MSVNISINMAGTTTRVELGVPDIEEQLAAQAMMIQAQAVILQSLSAKLDQLLAKENQMAADLNTLEQDVAAETTVENSAITLLTTISAELKAGANDPVRMQALATTIETRTAALAAAVAANTPAATTPPVGP